jgi:hypothetical protein
VSCADAVKASARHDKKKKYFILAGLSSKICPEKFKRCKKFNSFKSWSKFFEPLELFEP